MFKNKILRAYIILIRVCTLTYLVFIFKALSSVEAHPVTFEDGIVISTIHQGGFNLWHSNYSLNSRFAIGVDYLNINMGTASRIGQLRTNFLAKRWLGRGRQGNVYLLSGLGSRLNHLDSLTDEKHPVVMLGAQIDYETQQFYTALMGRAINQFSTKFDDLIYHALYRVGFAPYVSRTNELQAWFVAQSALHSGMNSKPNLTLLMRLFHQTALWEIGADTQGRPWLHLMSHF